MNAKPPKTLDTDQQLFLLTCLRRENAPSKTARKGIRNHLMGCLMLDAGLRVGEVVKLRYSHLYFNLAPVKSLVLTSSITKNHKERTVPVSVRLAEALSSFYTSWLLTDLNRDQAFVFYVTDNTHPLTTRQVENVIKTAGQLAFGRPINPHMLRHTFASKLMRVTDMRTVQVLLGHSYMSSTQIYTHPNEDDKKKAIADLEHEVTGLGKDLEDLAGLDS